MQDWLKKNSDITSLRLASVDLNGQARGKRIPSRFAAKIFKAGTRMPFSACNLDLLGQDIDDSPLVFNSGDADGTLRPTERGFVPMPWLNTPTALLPVWMFNEDGTGFSSDPRHALQRLLNCFADQGLTPVVALEMEFYLIDTAAPKPQIPRAPLAPRAHHVADTLSVRALDDFDAFLTDLYTACEAMSIPADAAISESGAGQFEINLLHCDDALRTADNAWFFKAAAKGIARKHGYTASFMAKPYLDSAGSGLHSHFSLLDRDGHNIFDDGTTTGSVALQHAVEGCLAAMEASSLVFAPFDNSYDRLVPDAHAPTSICWGYDNRTTALRIPASSPQARRIEHRVAGGDANPYLLLTAILGAALNGIEDRQLPAQPVTGNAYAQSLPKIAESWKNAIDMFGQSAQIRRIFDHKLIDNYLRCKRQELRLLPALDPDSRTALYLETL